MAREGWRSEGGLLSDNCDNGLIGQWGPGDTGGGGTRPAPAAQRAGKSGDKHTDSATPARSAARGILQHVYSVECVDMKTVSAGLLLGRAGDPSSCDRLPGSSQLWLVELAPITHLTAVILKLTPSLV